MITFNLENITEPQDRENAEKLATEFKTNPFLQGNLKHFELTITKAGNDYLFRHNLGFKPMDIWITWVSDSSAVVINYEDVNKDYISFDFPSPCTIRFFAGAIA
jgi:hypothetical protein